MIGRRADESFEESQLERPMQMEETEGVTDLVPIPFPAQRTFLVPIIEFFFDVNDEDARSILSFVVGENAQLTDDSSFHSSFFVQFTMRGFVDTFVSFDAATGNNPRRFATRGDQ